jgi:hypothetical protein
MVAIIAVALIVLVGPLALLYGVDSRVDDPRNGWPGTRR